MTSALLVTGLLLMQSPVPDSGTAVVTVDAGPTAGVEATGLEDPLEHLRRPRGTMVRDFLLYTLEEDGLHSQDEVVKLLRSTDRTPVTWRYVLDWFEDEPTRYAVHLSDLGRMPLDMVAVDEAAFALVQLGKPAEALRMIDDAYARRDFVKDEQGQLLLQTRIASLRCVAAYRAGRRDRVPEVCAFEADKRYISTGHRFLAVRALERGKPAEALARAERAVGENKNNAENHFVLALAQDALGKKHERDASLQQALALWPDYLPARRFGAGAAGLRDQLARMEEYRRRSMARGLAKCGLYFAELGIPERSERCFDAAETLWTGTGSHGRLELGARRGKPGVLEAADELVTRFKHPDTLALAAELHFEAGHREEAAKLIEAAVRADPGGQGISRVRALLCAAKVISAGCDEDLRSRIDPPNLGRTERGAFKVNSTYVIHTPPKVKRVSILPFSDRELAELEGLPSALREIFPGLRLQVLDPAPPPRAAYVSRRLEVTRAMKALPKEPMLVAITDDELSAGKARPLFAFDHPTLRGVVSTSRLRPGAPPAGTGSNAEAEDVSSRRLHLQAAHVIGRILGLSWPCKQTCLMREANDAADVDARGAQLCEQHEAELRERLPQRQTMPLWPKKPAKGQ